MTETVPLLWVELLPRHAPLHARWWVQPGGAGGGMPRGQLAPSPRGLQGGGQRCAGVQRVSGGGAVLMEHIRARANMHTFS